MTLGKSLTFSGPELYICTMRRLDWRCLRCSFGSNIQWFHRTSATFPSDSGSYIMKTEEGESWPIHGSPFSPRLTWGDPIPFFQVGVAVEGSWQIIYWVLWWEEELWWGWLVLSCLSLPSQFWGQTCWPFGGRMVPSGKGKRWPVLQVPAISC